MATFLKVRAPLRGSRRSRGDFVREAAAVGVVELSSFSQKDVEVDLVSRDQVGIQRTVEALGLDPVVQPADL